jgi:3-oxoacyl-[acyl-carrier-protein] synthase III
LDSVIRGIAYHLPEQVLTNEQLAAEYPDWSVEKIAGKTGIMRRHIAGTDECASDLGVAAAEALFAAAGCDRGIFDYLLLCTQSPDYFLPTTACLMQHRLGLPTHVGALDFNLGCSGYVYGLSLAKGLIETGQARNVLLVTAETYSKFIDPEDRTVRTLFGDAAAATWIAADDGAKEEVAGIGPFVFGTDGAGEKNLIVSCGGMRHRTNGSAPGVSAGAGALCMNGPEIFTFTLRTVPEAVAALIRRAEVRLEEVDHFVFHQANRYMLDHLRKKIGIPEEKFPIGLRDVGNTVSSTIPIALSDMQRQGRLRPGDRLMLVGFGVGYSWGAALIRWV